jgi:hypothetical protein
MGDGELVGGVYAFILVFLMFFYKEVIYEYLCH